MVLYNHFLLIRLFVNYPTLTGVASQFIDKLTWEIRERYIAIAEAFSSLGVHLNPTGKALLQNNQG